MLWLAILHGVQKRGEAHGESRAGVIASSRNVSRGRGSGMSVCFDTKSIPHLDREQTIREAIWRHVVRVEITHHPDFRQIVAIGAISSLGRLNLCSVKSNATTIRRTPTLARDDMEPSIFLGLQVSGSSIVVQDGREAVLRPGDMAIYDTTRPYTLLNDGGIHQHYFRVPRTDLALPDSVICRINAVRLCSANPIAGLAASYLARLARMQQSRVTGAAADAVGLPSVELVRALITTSLCESTLAVEPLEGSLELRVIEYMRTHLAEPDLAAPRIAAHHNMSVRQLYKILSRCNITPADWIRAQRLEACRKDLAKPAARQVTVESIARRWGLTDATHFSRAFKETYGISPREWRDQGPR
ncbi:MAG: helix-turn-helix domain-containing protein [Jatrophihabitantaceae bacterium]